MITGSHLSISGGLENALIAAEKYGFEALAIFVRNQRQWQAKELADDQVEIFKKTRKNTRISTIVAHASYLVNLASETDTRDKSLVALADDLGRCDRLSIEYLVFHPGSNKNTEKGIDLIAAGLDEIFDSVGPTYTKILLETTAGQGKCIGSQFEHIAAIIDKSKNLSRLAVCLDTAHIWAAGYDISTAKGCEAVIKEFDEIIGLDKLKAIHCNDSQKDCGSRVDRHEHIGKGKIGLAGFEWLVNCRQLKDIPFILETPKGEDSRGRDWDEINKATLEKLVK